MRQPDFNNLLKVLRREVPTRPTLFEFFLNIPLYERLTGEKVPGNKRQGELYYSDYGFLITAFKNAGYDYAIVRGSDFAFPKNEIRVKSSISLNDGSIISDRESFKKYPWTEPDSYNYSRLEKSADILPDGMKLIVYSDGGVLENVIGLLGFDNLCFMLSDDPDLVQEVFDAVGSRLLKYYKIVSKFNMVGAVISNDDWGFNTQTMLSPELMRRFVFPWHKKIVETIHAAGKPAILHSCGNAESVFDDIIYDMKFDAKHSFEDNILPVEDAYEKWGSQIAILGGLDVNFICCSTPESITERSLAMLERSACRGGYALGSGNSIPDYVPQENYFAMIKAAME